MHLVLSLARECRIVVNESWQSVAWGVLKLLLLIILCKVMCRETITWQVGFGDRKTLQWCIALGFLVQVRLWRHAYMHVGTACGCSINSVSWLKEGLRGTYHWSHPVLEFFLQLHQPRVIRGLKVVDKGQVLYISHQHVNRGSHSLSSRW